VYILYILVRILLLPLATVGGYPLQVIVKTYTYTAVFLHLVFISILEQTIHTKGQSRSIFMIKDGEVLISSRIVRCLLF